MKVALMPDDKAKQTSDEELGLETKEAAQQRLKTFAELGIDAKQVINAVDFEQIGMKAYFEEKNREFVVVGIAPNSEAFEKEVKMGDKIISVDDAKPFGIEDLKFKLKKAEAKGSVSLTMLSGTNVYTINLKIGNSDEQN
jgi:C-terminal processing protease CtpA/Prc